MNSAEKRAKKQVEPGAYTDYVVDSIAHVCQKIGPRACGRKEERDAQAYMAEDLRKCADSVKREEFRVAPEAFMAWVPVCVVLNIAAVILYLLGFAAISLALTVLSLFFVITEFLMYKKTLDVFFPKRTSGNVVAVRKAAGETKRRIILSGHADSAMEWRFTFWGGSKLLLSMVILGLSGFFLNVLVFAIGIAKGYAFNRAPEGGLQIAGYFLLFWCIFYLANLAFNDWKGYVQGANDNLTGCFSAIAVLQYLQDQGIRFENTEVVAVMTGGEEAGLRGAKAFCKAHSEEYQDAETVFIGLETFRDYEHMAIYSRDLTGTVKNSPGACKLVKQAAEKAGYHLPYKSVFFGASDAAAVSQAGIPATTLASMDPTPARYYHTRLDTWDNLDPKTITAGIEIATQATLLFDKNGLPDA